MTTYVNKYDYMIGVMGKRGSGKTEFVKKSLPEIRRFIVCDVLHEYEDGLVFDSWAALQNHLDETNELDFRLIYQPPNDDDLEFFFEYTINGVNDYTLIMEEIDYHCSANWIHPSLDEFARYGRHERRNMIWISRNPFEVNRFITRQTNVFITFLQTEPRDLEYFRKIGTFSKQIDTLGRFEWAYHCTDYDKHLITDVLHKKIS